MDNLYNTLVGLTGGGAGDDDTVLNPPNAPVIPDTLSDNTTMQLVKYDEDSGEWVEDKEGTSWSYNAGTGEEDHKSSHWANAKVTITYEGKGSVDSYFVWIPRYAYKITPKEEGQAAGTIDVVFLQGTTDNYIDEEGNTQKAKRVTDDDIKSELYSKDYVVHPAFTKTEDTAGNKTFDNGEWKDELPGLWVGKYETSHTGCGSTKTSGEGELGENKITIKPGITSWRKDTIGNFYTAARNYSEDLNSHMLKNSEWGAVAYLTHSQYGRNGHEISINNSSDYITGTGGNEASSTGNEYGIYDLSGGAHEYVAAYYNGSDANESNINNGSSFAKKNKASDAYATAYTGDNESLDYKKGDATYETKNWNSGDASFVGWPVPFFSRGGRHGSSSKAGVFYYSSTGGYNNYYYSFRVCLAVV